MQRCAWAKENNHMYCKYHDTEWGVPLHADQKLFELLLLESAQAGLSWETVLKKRENYRKAFDDFDPQKICNYDDSKERELLENAGIIRNKLKIRSAIRNAKVFLEIQKEFKSFDKYIWSFIDYKVIKNSYKKTSELPAQTEISEMISKDLKKRGMTFVGPTIIYAYMQAIGMANDHEVSCFRYSEV